MSCGSGRRSVFEALFVWVVDAGFVGDLARDFGDGEGRGALRAGSRGKVKGTS